MTPILWPSKLLGTLTRCTLMMMLSKTHPRSLRATNLSLKAESHIFLLAPNTMPTGKELKSKKVFTSINHNLNRDRVRGQETKLTTAKFRL